MSLAPDLPPDLPPDLAAALARLARVPRLLVASDYDGVLAPIVTDPARAYPVAGAVAVLRGLAALPDTTVAAISGRSRDDLATVSGLPPAEVLLVGSHGAELTDGVRLQPRQRELRERLLLAAREIAADRPGVRVETKPASVVLHTRTADHEVTADAVAAVHRGPATWTGVHLTTGKEVLELAVVTADKGTAVTALCEQTAAGAVLFLGDDVTDENAFAVLAADDVGIKIGPGATAARFRIPDPPAAVATLDHLLHGRSARAASI